MTQIEPKKVLIAFVCCDILFLCLHLSFSTHPLWGERFDLGQEGNLPTWYSSFKFTLASFMALQCYFSSRQNKRIHPAGWLPVAGLMLMMSMDETGQLHETVTLWVMDGAGEKNLRDYFLVSQEGGALLWTLIFSPLIILAGGALAYFYYIQFRAQPKMFVAALAMVALLGAAAGLETLQAKILGNENYLDAASWGRFKLFSTVEEMAELFGATLLLWLHLSFARLIEMKNDPNHS